MPLLQLMYFDLVNLDGSLPAEWGSHHSFQQLTDLYIANEDPQYYDTGLYGGHTGGGSSLYKWFARPKYTEAVVILHRQPTGYAKPSQACHVSAESCQPNQPVLAHAMPEGLWQHNVP